MYVGLKMLRDFVKVSPSTLVKDAQKLMDESKLWMLLVMEGEELLGYLRKEDVNAALPSVMTGLDKHELNYLMAKLNVGKIFKKDITTIPPETEIEAAAALMDKENLAGLAVVDSGSKVLGYINRGVMLDVLVEEMGYRQGGSRLVIEVVDRAGVLFEVAGIVAGMGESIISTGTFFHNGTRMVVVRVDTDDPSRIAAALQDKGFKLVSAMDFMHEWRK